MFTILQILLTKFCYCELGFVIIIFTIIFLLKLSMYVKILCCFCTPTYLNFSLAKPFILTSRKWCINCKNIPSTFFFQKLFFWILVC